MTTIKCKVRTIPKGFAIEFGDRNITKEGWTMVDVFINTTAEQAHTSVGLSYIEDYPLASDDVAKSVLNAYKQYGFDTDIEYKPVKRWNRKDISYR